MDTKEIVLTNKENHNVLAHTPPRTAKELLDQASIIRDVLNSVMQAGVDYDTVAGTKNKSLLKPGTEKIMAVFRLACNPLIADLSTPDEIRYRIEARLTHAPTDTYVGSGIGECSSHEAKYKWRKPVCDEEFEELKSESPERCRNKWVKYGTQKARRNPQVRTEPADIANTVLKMAKKRALADAVLTATACSDIFDRSEPEGDQVKHRDQHAPASGGNVNIQDVTKRLELEADNGLEALNLLWASLQDSERLAIGKDFWRIKNMCPAKNK